MILKGKLLPFSADRERGDPPRPFPRACEADMV